jgi:hypothetical protein
MNDGERALGTRAAPQVEEQVLGRGESWQRPRLRRERMVPQRLRAHPQFDGKR